MYKAHPDRFHPLLAMALSAVMALLAACGSGRQPAGLEATLTSQPIVAAAEGLPALDALPAPTRMLSFTGPGYQSFDGSDCVQAANTVDAGRKLELPGNAPFSYAVYRLGGFSGDMRPTCLRLSGEDYNGSYWLAYADYRQRAWRFSGPLTGDYLLQLPAAASPSGLADFISPDGACSAVVMAAPGSSLTVDTLEFGVDGGAEAPGGPTYISVRGGIEGVLISWEQFLYEPEADLAGYVVERADLLSTVFVQLNDGLLSDRAYLDSTAHDGHTYQYRVGSVDTSGNRGYSEIAVCSKQSISVGAVCLVDVDPGPYYAPATVHFDFSRSFVVGPGSLDTYDVYFFNGPTSNGSSPQVDIIMQPGCYFGVASVAGPGISDSTYFQIKVLPRWEENTHLVFPSQTGLLSRASYAQLARLPGDNSLCLFGYDNSLESLVAYRQHGADFTMQMCNPFGLVINMNEVVPYGDKLAIPVVEAEGLIVFLYDGEDFSLGASMENLPGNTALGVASAGENGGFVVYPRVNGAQTDLALTSIPDEGLFQTVALNVGNVLDLDCVWNEAAGALDIFYADLDSMQWVRWDPVNAIALDGELLASYIAPASVDAELRPTTGQPAVLTSYGGDWFYRAFDGSAWSPGEQIDPAASCQLRCDLDFCGGNRYVYGTIDGGASALYEYNRDTALWDQVALPMLELWPTAMSLCESAVPGNVLAGTVAAGAATIYDLTPNGGESLLFQRKPVSGAGRSIKSAAGNDGLFAGMLDATGKLYLARSTTGGIDWFDSGPDPATTATAFDMGSQSDGEVYFSTDNFGGSGEYRVYLWDEITHDAQQLPYSMSGPPQYRPFISNSPTEDSVTWVCYDDTLKQVRILSGKAGVLATTVMTPAVTPLWLGSISGSEVNSFFALGGGLNLWDASFMQMDPETLGLAYLATPSLLTAPPTTIGTSPLVLSHALDSCKFLELDPSNFMLPYSVRYGCCMAYGHGLDALRVECDNDGMQLELHPMAFGGSYQDIFGSELRRTVSSAEAKSYTGVSIMSTLDGSQCSFQWSSFGDWEDLPLPPGWDKMSSPELLVGFDGRWHLIWHDLESDAVFCRSSL